MQHLRSAEMFKGMGEADLTSLEHISKLKSLQSGQRIFKEGDAGDGLYFIIRGRIQISARFGDDQRRVFATFGPGEFFGEMAVLDDAPRSADAIAEEASDVYFVPRANLAEILERNPKLALRMLHDFSRRLREFDRKYIDEALQVERLVTVGKFARTIIHDLKNPLHIIAMSAEMMSIQGTSLEMQAAGKSRIRNIFLCGRGQIESDNAAALMSASKVVLTLKSLPSTRERQKARRYIRWSRFAIVPDLASRRPPSSVTRAIELRGAAG